MRRVLFSLISLGLVVTSLSSCGTTQSTIPIPAAQTAAQNVSRSTQSSQFGRHEDFMPQVRDQDDVLNVHLADGRVLKFPGTAKITRVRGRWRVNGPGYQIAMANTGVTEINRHLKGKNIPITGGPTGAALPNGCANLDGCCSFNCGGGGGMPGCDASHQNCGPCPDCGGPIRSSLQDQLDCYYDPSGQCGNDSLGNPFGKLIMKFPGGGGYGGITCLWDVSDQAYIDGTDLNCADDEPNALNAPFNGVITISYTWSRSLGQTTIQCGVASPNYVTQALFTYAETEGNIRLTGEKVVRDILPGQTTAAHFKPSLGINSLTNGTYTYRAFVLGIAAFCNGAIATPVP